MHLYSTSFGRHTILQPSNFAAILEPSISAAIYLELAFFDLRISITLHWSTWHTTQQRTATAARRATPDYRYEYHRYRYRPRPRRAALDMFYIHRRLEFCSHLSAVSILSAV